MELEVNVTGEGAERVVHLTGTCDLATVPRLRETLLALRPPEVTRLVIDLSVLEFCDSTGLGTMLGALRRMKEGGGSFAIAGAHGTVRRLLEVTGLDEIVPLV
jgi:anti-sigma B factor antagonist